MFWPLFTLQMVPFFRSSRLSSMPFQVGEEFDGKLVSSRFPWGKYFALSNLAQRLSGLCRRRQACLARRAWLKRARSRKPMPPLSFAAYSVGWFVKKYCWLVCVRKILFCMKNTVHTNSVVWGGWPAHPASQHQPNRLFVWWFCPRQANEFSFFRVHLLTKNFLSIARVHHKDLKRI